MTARPSTSTFILINAIALPILGLGACTSALPADVSGAPPETPYRQLTGGFVGEGVYKALRGRRFRRRSAIGQEILVSGDQLVGDGLMGQLDRAIDWQVRTTSSISFRVTTPTVRLTFRLQRANISN